VTAADHSHCNLARNCGWSLLAAAIPGPEWSVHVVITPDPCRDAKIFAKMPAHSFAEQLLPAIAVFGHGRVGLRLFESGSRFVDSRDRRRRMKKRSNVKSRCPGRQPANAC